MRNVQVEFPIKHIEGNLVFGQDGHVWAYYEIASYDYTYRSPMEKKKMRNKWITLYSRIKNDCHILQIPEFLDIELHHEQLQKRFHSLKNEATAYIHRATQVLKENIKEPTNIRTFVGFRLKHINRRAMKRKLRKTLYHKWADFRRYVGTISGLSAGDILEEELFEYQELEKTLYEEVKSVLNCHSVDAMDVQWIIRQSVYRGISEPILREDWQPAKQVMNVGDQQIIKPQPLNIMSLAAGLFESNEFHLRIKQFDEVAGEVKSGYSAFLYVTDFPEDLPFPNGEWAYLTQSLKFPVEISSRINVISNEAALNELNKRKLRISNQVNHTRTEGQQIDAYLEDSYEIAVEKEREIREEGMPVLKVSAILCVSAASIQQLNERIRATISIYRTKGIELQVSAGDQFLGFNDFLPAGDRYVSDFIHYLEPSMQAGAMFGATQTLGDGKGFFIGYTGSSNVERLKLRKPVFLDTALAAQQVGNTNSLSMVFFGETGFGKSQSMDLLIYLSVLLKGARTLIIDPKGERGEWKQKLPFLKDHINIVTLGSDLAHKGKFDPFVIFDPLDAAVYAKDVLMQLSSAKRGDEWSGVIQEAIQEVRKETSAKNRSMSHVLRLLKSKDSKLYRRLASYEEYAFSQLVFGDGSQTETLKLVDPLNVLQIQDLRLPSRDKNPENYTEVEILSRSILLPLTGYTEKLMKQDRGILKQIAWDECWSTLSSELGKDAITKGIREGRYWNSGMLLATQNPTDIDGELINNIGMKFVFKLEDPIQITRALEVLRLENNESNREAIQNLSHGECFFRDIHGRVGRLYFDTLFPEISEAFSTTPPESSDIYDDLRKWEV